MPTKRLPQRPSLSHLKNQAHDLLADKHAQRLDAFQRIREFHPRFTELSDSQMQAAAFSLSDAYLTIAREYGFANWARLRAQLTHPTSLDLPQHERIADETFRLALGLADDADVDGLKIYLAAHPHVVRQRLEFEGENYFRHPSLLEFIAENPVRHGRLDTRVIDVARVILEAGARSDRAALDSTLALVGSGRIAREGGVQIALIELLVEHGANPSNAIGAAAAHGEFEAVEALLRRGAALDITIGAAIGRTQVVSELLPRSTPQARHAALAMSCQHGHAEVVRRLLEAGEDPNRYNPVGFHAHSTPLHQAALAGHFDVVRVLVEHGARNDLKDIHHQGTAADWADHAGHSQIASYLRSQPI